MTLGEVLVDDLEVPAEYFIPPKQLRTWEYLKGAKREERVLVSKHDRQRRQ